MVDKKKMGNLLIGMRLALSPASHQCLAHLIRNHPPGRAFLQSPNEPPVYCLPPFTRRSLYHSALRVRASFFPFAAALHERGLLGCDEERNLRRGERDHFSAESMRQRSMTCIRFLLTTTSR